MLEISTDALVVDREDSGECDSRVFLYTREVGAVVARATSARKVTSKLAAHLEPLNWISVRLIERRGAESVIGTANFQIGDALLINRSEAWRKSPEALRGALNLIQVFKERGFRGDSDPELWASLYNMFTAPPSGALQKYAVGILKSLGFDPLYARCRGCSATPPTQFIFQDLSFYCGACVPPQTSFMLKYHV